MPQNPHNISRVIIADYLRLLRQPFTAPEVSASPVSTVLPVRDTSRPCALLLSPHPDDECLTGVLPLRLLREQNWQIINIAVTLGSDLARRAERKEELAKASAALGFVSALPKEDGFSDIDATARSADPVLWRKKVARIAEMIAQVQPQAIFMPHAEDGHATHIGTHWLGMDALATIPQNLSYFVVQTEYWHPMSESNLMVGSEENDVATLMSALACHVGEVARNAYDRRFPAYLIDNIRRGSERLGGAGTTAKAMDFAELYKLGLWRQGKFVPSALNRFVEVNESVGTLFE